MTETTPEKIGATDVSISTTEKAKTHQWWFQLNRKALEEYAGGLDESVLVDSVLVPVPVPDIDWFTDVKIGWSKYENSFPIVDFKLE